MKNNNRVLLFLLGNYFEQCAGGAELQAYYLARIAVEKGWEVHYIFVSNGSPYRNSLGLHLHPIKQNKIWSKLKNIKYPYAVKLLMLMRKINPDIIYQRAGFSFTGIAAFFSRNRNTRLCFHIAHDNDVNPVDIYRKRFYYIPETLITKYGIRHADRIFAQTNSQNHALMKNFSRSATAVIPNGHPVPDLCEKDPDFIHVLWIANMKPAKQPEIFFRLAKDLSQNRHVRFTMIGRVDNYHSLARAAAEDHSLSVLGEIPNDEVNRLLCRSHILVNTSKSEGFSNTFIQAWLRRVPVISLTVDPDDVLKKEGIGFCSGSYDRLVRDVNKLIEDRTLLSSMGDKARNFATKHYSLDNMEKLLELF